MTGTRYSQLRRYPVRLMFLALVLIVAALAAYFAYSLRFVEVEILQARDTVLGLVSDSIVQATREAQTFAYGIAYNANVQRSFTETDVPRRIEYVNAYYQLATFTAATNEFIDDIAVFTRDLSVFRNLSQNITYADYKGALLRFLEASRGRGGQFVAIDPEAGERYLCYVWPVRPFGGQSDEAGGLGYCLTSFAMGRMGSYFDRVSTLRNSIIAILDGSGSAVALTGTLPRGGAAGLEEVLADPRGYLVSDRPIPGIDYTLRSFVPIASAYRGERVFVGLSAILIGILSSVIVILGARFNTTFTAPLNGLIGQLSAIDGTDRDRRISSIPDNEIGYIARSINGMLDKINDLTEREARDQRTMHDLELQTKEAELLALQSQINPHFMYNTLECIRSLGMDLGSGEIVQTSTALADILRYCLSGERLVPLEREIDIVRQYLGIIAFRFGDRYRFEVRMEGATGRETIMKMILQPIVENAVFHGLEKERTGSLAVECCREGDLLELVVTDDGAGIEAGVLEGLQARLLSAGSSSDAAPAGGRGVGLLNIHRRLRASYGEAYGLSVARGAERGTVVTVRLPCP
jgi:two-component system, sensor histidine kinase YesM